MLSKSYLGKKKGKTVAYRRKYVASHMKERKVIEGAISPNIDLETLGDVFNVKARHRKALQHLEERGEEVTYKSLVQECDADFEKEYKEEIMNILWKRYAPAIMKAARKDLSTNLDIKSFQKE